MSEKDRFDRSAAARRRGAQTRSAHDRQNRRRQRKKTLTLLATALAAAVILLITLITFFTGLSALNGQREKTDAVTQKNLELQRQCDETDRQLQQAEETIERLNGEIAQMSE